MSLRGGGSKQKFAQREAEQPINACSKTRCEWFFVSGRFVTPRRWLDGVACLETGSGVVKDRMYRKRGEHQCLIGATAYHRNLGFGCLQGGKRGAERGTLLYCSRYEISP